MQIIPVIKKEGMFGIYYKESLALKTLNIINLTEYFVCEVSGQNKKGYFVVAYRRPTQSA